MCLLFTDGEGSRQEVTYRELHETSVHLATGLAHIRGSTGVEHEKCALKIALVILPKIYPWWVTNITGAWNGESLHVVSMSVNKCSAHHEHEI